MKNHLLLTETEAVLEWRVQRLQAAEDIVKRTEETPYTRHMIETMKAELLSCAIGYWFLLARMEVIK